jgi:chromosomal replication initiator protein
MSRTNPRDRAVEIFGRVAAYFGYTFDELRGLGKARALNDARRIAYYLARKITGLAFDALGPLLGRDGSSISHACRMVARKLERWPGGSTALAIAQAEGALA